MERKKAGLVLDSEEDYRKALERAEELRETGAKTDENPELAELEGAILEYTAKPGQPAERKGKPGSKKVG